jgi:hypothetical protein
MSGPCLGMRPTTIAMVMVLAFAMLSPNRVRSVE